jgi:hypothetical protein
VIPVIDAASDDAELPSMLDASLGDAGCTAVENNCMDGRDNDCNGAVDCDDPSCTSRPICGGCTAPCP